MDVPQACATTAVPPVSGPVRENWYWYVPVPPEADAVYVTDAPAVAGLGTDGVKESFS